MSDVITYPLSVAIEFCEQLDNDQTNYYLKMLEYKRERNEARDALMKIEDLFIDGTDIYADREKMGMIARNALEETK
jgi:hypothetical protein